MRRKKKKTKTTQVENVPLNIPREPTKEWIYYACGWVDDPRSFQVGQGSVPFAKPRCVMSSDTLTGSSSNS